MQNILIDLKEGGYQQITALKTIQYINKYILTEVSLILA